MRKNQLKGFVMGCLVTLLLVSTVFGAQITKQISVVYNDIKLEIDGKLITLKDAKGNVIEPFTYNGTTYLPLRAVGEALGKDVAWDGKTNTVKLSSISSASPTMPTAPTPIQATNSRTNPAGLNQKFIVNAEDIFTGSYELEIEMNELIAGDQAWAIIGAANMFNQAAPEGKEYILAKFRVKLLNIADNKTFNINPSYFDSISAKGVLYNEFISIAGLEPKLSTELYKDAEIEGWTYFLVDKSDSPVCAINRGSKGEVWFNLRAK